jgi:hypothetical protein
MFSKKFLVVAGLLVGTSTTAFAHITIATGPVQAGRNAKIALSISHGCNNSSEDTWKVRVNFPAGTFSSVRAMRSDFGTAVVLRDNNMIVGVEWTKPDADKRDEDDYFYELAFRAAVPNKPFTKVKFDITQTCTDDDGNPTTPVVWDDELSSDPEPSPRLVILPQKVNTIGWNKLTIPAATTVAAADLDDYFPDALIVWKGTSAFSINPNTVEQINATTGVTFLASDLAAGDVIWVRY